MSTKPISVLMFANATVRGGAEEHILELLNSLDSRRFRLHLACPAALVEKYANEIPKDVQVTQLMLDHLWDLSGSFCLVHALYRHKIDILHSHMFRASLFASPLGWLCRVPVTIETSHGREVWREGQGWLKSQYFVDRVASKFVDQFIAVSYATGRHLTEQKNIPTKKIRVIHNGCNLQKFDPGRPVPEGLRGSLGFSDSDPVLVALARLEPQKGHHVLLQAMPTVLREFPNARLVCVGSGVLRLDLEKQTDLLGIREAVRFVGHQTNAPDWLALADLTVLPSYYEGLPLVAIESLAAGRTMVATAVDGTPDVVVDGKTGLTVPPGDSQKLAAALCILLRDSELRHSLAQAGRRHVLEAFSLRKFVSETEQCYLDVWARHQQPVAAPRFKGTEEFNCRP
ncbi:MAG: glycosyltransferase family 4 protein [Candidatus Acidiferrales bacterium]